MWPIQNHPYYGIFVKEQIEGLLKNYPDLETEVFFINGKQNKLNYLFSIIAINFKLIFNKYDVIHIHFGLSGLFLLFNPFIKTPIVTTLHSADIDIVKSNNFFIWVSKRVIKRSERVFYLNDKMLNMFQGQKEKLIYLPCGVNTDDFYEEKVDLESKTIKIGFPANKLRPEKNYDLFDKIVSIIKKESTSDIEIIEFHNKTRMEIRESLNAIDLLIMTSISEGSPQIIKEALSCNTPIISTNVGDVEKLLAGVSNCYLVNSFMPEDFIQPVLNILKEKNQGQRSDGRKQIFKLSLDEKSISKRIYNEYAKLKK